MSWKCEYSGKKPQVGHRVVRRGKAKKAGGIGQNVTGISKRRWYPNLQSVRVMDEKGTVRRIRVGTRYLKAGKFVKAPRGLHKMYVLEQARKAKTAQTQS